MEYKLRRKIDNFLTRWREDPDRLPLIIKGARQVGKTSSIRHFAESYSYFIEINFIAEPQYRTIFSSGYSPDEVIKEISFINPKLKFVPKETLILFDEMQACPDCATCLKFFKLDGRYDVICSGSLLGINYEEVTSVSVGYKQDYEMHSLDFEEFLWAKGYTEDQITSIYNHIHTLEPFSENEFAVWMNCFKEYLVIGGMPRVVSKFIEQNNFSGRI